MARKIFYIIFSIILSIGLIISIPVITILVKEGFRFTKDENIRKTVISRSIKIPQAQPQKKIRQQPRRRQSPRQSTKSGPRFAMSLGTQGLSGVGIPLNLTNKSSGSGEGNDQGVDERPQLNGQLQIDIPEVIKSAEKNASVRLMFCVDIQGNAFDIRVTEENPSGMGLAQNAIAALKKNTFKPAVLNGRPVSFCGMEQPIEIKFRN